MELRYAPMWKKTWLLGILVTATALSGCTCGNGNAGSDPGGVSGTGTPADSGTGSTSDDGGTTSDGGGTDAASSLGSLLLLPTNPILDVSDGTVKTQTFTLRGTFADGHTEDVTSKAAFSIDDTRLGLFSGANFNTTSTVGGASNVHARVGTMSVATGITVRFNQSVPDSSSGSATGTTPLPSDPGSKFNGPVVTDGSQKPQVVYPNSGALVPPNLGQLEFHFLPGNSTNSLFELRFTNTVTDLRVYLRCYLPSGFTLPSGVSRGCIYTPEAKVWTYLAETNRGGDPVRVTMRATDDSGTGAVGTSAPISLQFARSDLRGALYYWTTAPSHVGVMRYDFANPDPAASKTAESILTNSNISTGVSCVGCHALSRNGKKVVAEVNGQADGRVALIDLSTWKSTDKTSLQQNGAKLSTFESWNPDGTQYVGVYGDSGATRNNLMIFDGSTAGLVSEIAGTGTSASSPTHPDWSSDGKTIAYMSPGYQGTNQRSFKGSIKMVKANTDGSWSAPITVVPMHDPSTTGNTAKNRYYPAIAPDNSFLVYDESTCPTGGDTNYTCDSDTDQSARLWAAPLTANAPRTELANANRGGVMDGSTVDLTTSYPKWSPFVTQGSKSGGRLMWVTFSSSRNFGLRTIPNSTDGSENTKGSQLWMAAVDPDKVAAGVDPSYPAFFLPFQDITTSNHIAQWAQYLVSNGCSTDGETCGGSATCCNGLQCVQLNQDPPIPCSVSGACSCQAIPQCAASFEKCSSVAPCCDGLSCVNDSTGSACSGTDSTCTCHPPCSGNNQTCGGASPCCEGLTCTAGASGSTCQVKVR